MSFTQNNIYFISSCIPWHSNSWFYSAIAWILMYYQVMLLFTHSKERAGAIFGLKCLTLKEALMRIHLTISHLILTRCTDVKPRIWLVILRAVLHKQTKKTTTKKDPTVTVDILCKLFVNDVIWATALLSQIKCQFCILLVDLSHHW